jgi:putative hydrolase of the HAD superfamily
MLESVTYRAIIFDLGRVLVHFDFERAYRELESICPHAAAEIPRRLAGTGLVERFETGLIEPRDFVAELTQILDLNVTFERFCDLFCAIFTDILVPDSLVEHLATRYRLVLLSNTNAIHFEMIRRTYPILRHFHALVLSHEVKAMKPQPEIYRAAIEKAGCLPEECFYTDDIAAYIEGAQRMGIDAVQFENAEQLQREMRARGIL